MDGWMDGWMNGLLNLPLDECNFTRFEACPASLDLRSCLRASCSALRDSGWNNFSFLVAFCGFFVGDMSIETFLSCASEHQEKSRIDSIIISGRLAPTNSSCFLFISSRICDDGPIATPGVRQRPYVAFRGELEGKWGWTDEPLYLISFIGSLPARRIRLKPSQWLQITPTIPPSQ